MSGAPHDVTDRHSANLYVRKASPIMMAASRHGPEMLGLLISRGAEATVLDTYHSTPIDYLCCAPTFGTAADADAVRCLTTLVRQGANVNAADRDGSTALMLAWLYGASLDTVTALLDFRASVNATNRSGNTAPTLAIIRGRIPKDSKMAALLCLVELLGERGADVTLVDAAGRDALTIARETPAWSGKVHELALILAKYRSTIIGKDTA
jgi:ankyrin repeat protein